MKAAKFTPKNTLLAEGVLAAGVPDQVLDDFFGIWAIEEGRFRQVVDRYQGINLVAHVQQNRGFDHLRADEPVAAAGDVQAADDRRLFALEDGGVAVVRLRGPLMKYYSSMSSNASTVFARRQIRQAVRDDAVSTILLLIDSPGGTVAGTMDLANEVAKANERKPVVAFVDDLTASAAYWVASQASKVFANNSTALVGSIGTYAVLHDYSKAAEELGVKVHVIKAGQFKGSGTPGTEITESQLAEMQRIVDSLNAEFLDGVAQGRGLPLSEVLKIADGRVHPATEALNLKLIDGIQSYEATVAELSKRRRRSYKMTTDNQQTQAATLQELKAAIPDADPSFLVEQMEQGATLDQAVRSFAAKVKAENDALQKRLDDLEAKQKERDQAAANQADQADGVEPLGGESSNSNDDYIGASGDPVADFDNEVRRRMQANPQLGRQRCVLAVARANPDLHQAFLLATNPSRKVNRLLNEKYEEVGS